MISRRHIWAAALTGALCLLSAPAAGAAVRYAAPGGGGTACSQAAPCHVQTAVEDPAVASGDEIVLLPGVHAAGANPLDAKEGLYIHGIAGAPRPVIEISSGFVGVVVRAGGRLEHVEVRSSAPALATVLFPGASAERIVSISTPANSSFGCYLQPDANAPPNLAESACIATGSAGVGLLSSVGVSAGVHALATIRNVTAVATGPSSTGVKSSASGNGGSVTLRGVNAIASGTASDAVADGGPNGSIAFAQLTFSNFDSQLELSNAAVTDPGSDSNVTQPALLVDPASGDVHQRPGSWTIDRGSSAASGLDIDGEPRFQGPAPDIGADEFVTLRQARKCFGAPVTIAAPAAGTIRGTKRRDVIIGTAGRDTIVSLGGGDLVCGLGGRDTIRTGAGADRAKGEGGADRLSGQGGRDKLLGGGGRDRLRGGAGKDRLSGQGGRDRLLGGGGKDRCGRASGKDRVAGCE